MAPWSNDSWAHWICRLRLPAQPRSVMGLRPAVKSIGTLDRAAFMMPPSALAAPTMTCTITACGRPVTMAKPCAMATAGSRGAP